MFVLELKASDGMMLMVHVTDDNVHIVDSYRIRDDKEKLSMIQSIRISFPQVWEGRTDESLIAEWKGHNALYNRGKWIAHTKDVDLESRQSAFLGFVWSVVNLLFKEK